MTTQALPETPSSHPFENTFLEKGGRCCCIYIVGPLALISMVATGIIGSLGILGFVPSLTLGTFLVISSSLTLTASLLLFSMSTAKKEKILGAVGALASITFTVIGALAAAYIVSYFSVSWVCVGGSIGTIGGGMLYYKGALK